MKICYCTLCNLPRLQDALSVVHGLLLLFSADTIGTRNSAFSCNTEARRPALGSRKVGRKKN